MRRARQVDDCGLEDEREEVCWDESGVREGLMYVHQSVEDVDEVEDSGGEGEGEFFRV